MKIIKGHLITGDGSSLYIQRKNKIYKIDNAVEQHIIDISMPLWKNILINVRLFQRLLRTDIRTGIVCGNTFFYAFSGNLYSYHLVNHESRKELAFRNGMRAPLVFTDISGIKGFDDQVCFGEYFSNKDREAVNIWSNRGGKWEIVYSFPQNTIRHIHGIVTDQYRNCVYVLTGDNDAESAIWKAENNFENVNKLIWGDQQARCCVLQPRKDCIVYATDSEYEQNKVYKVAVRENGKTEREIVSNLSGSVIYGLVMEENKMIFSTTVEPSKGGINTDRATVYELDDDLKLHKIISDRKDFFNPKFFQYGSANIARSAEGLCVSFTATKKYDGKIVVINE